MYTLTRLKNYAEWYYTKYFPSRQTLLEKLRSKCDDEDMVKQVMGELESLIIEDKNIESRVHEYVGQGRTAQYICTKLLTKKFDRNLIQESLQLESDILKDPENYRVQIEQAKRRGQQKGVAKKMLTYELSMKYQEAKSIIGEILSDYDDCEILEKKAPELLKKYTQEQLLQKLSQKGFAISDIYTVLRRL